MTDIEENDDDFVMTKLGLYNKRTKTLYMDEGFEYRRRILMRENKEVQYPDYDTKKEVKERTDLDPPEY